MIPELPIEIWEDIFEHVDSVEDKYKLSVTCKGLRPKFTNKHYFDLLQTSLRIKENILRVICTTAVEKINNDDIILMVTCEGRIYHNDSTIVTKRQFHFYDHRDLINVSTLNKKLMKRYTSVPFKFIENLVNDMNRIGECLHQLGESPQVNV